MGCFALRTNSGKMRNSIDYLKFTHSRSERRQSPIGHCSAHSIVARSIISATIHRHISMEYWPWCQMDIRGQSRVSSRSWLYPWERCNLYILTQEHALSGPCSLLLAKSSWLAFPSIRVRGYHRLLIDHEAKISQPQLCTAHYLYLARSWVGLQGDSWVNPQLPFILIQALYRKL